MCSLLSSPSLPSLADLVCHSHAHPPRELIVRVRVSIVTHFQVIPS